MRRAVMFLAAIVLVAGCVGQTDQFSSGDGLQITSFTSDTDNQVSARDIRMFLEIENGGECLVDAEKTLVYLNGPIGTDLLQWEMIEGTQAMELKRNMSPYDPLRDIPPGRDSIRWRVRAPELDSGQQKTDTFTARIYYDYETKVIGEVTAYSEAESVAASQRGEPLETSSFSTTAGPIGVSVRAIPDPVVVVDGEETLTLEIVVENVGGGTLYKKDLITSASTEPTLEYDDLNRVHLEVDAGPLQDKILDSCDGEQELIGGRPTTLTCDIKVPMPAIKTTYPIKVSLTYGYYIDAPIDLTAVGRR